MAFQRSYSKVWWGSYPENPNYNTEGGFRSLDSNIKWSGNLSRIQEADESSKFWGSHDSPGSLRSQDSGFSDNEESHRREKSPNKQYKSFGSPSSIKTVPTPPTIIRRNPVLSPILASHQKSLSAPSSPTYDTKDCDDINQIDRISILNNAPMLNEIQRAGSPCNCSTPKDKSIRRRRVGNERTRRSLLVNMENVDNDNSRFNFKEYNNETVYFGAGEDDNNNLFKCFEDNVIEGTPLQSTNTITASTSTPKNCIEKTSTTVTLPYHFEYENAALNGHPLSVQYWLDDLRWSYNHEVMSTLQTKSIAQEAFRNLKITTTTVAKIIRQLQTRSIILQGEFERVEKNLRSEKISKFRDALVSSMDLVESVRDFSKTLERRSVFFTEHRADRTKFEDNIDHIQLITKDLRVSLEKQHYLDTDSLFEDIQVLKRYVLITLRLVFEKLISVIIANIENSKCDLMLRANLNMVATLSNIDYSGFASLNDAFIKNESIRVFLLTCLDNKFSTVRALALRALATICSSTESIRQLGEAGGVEIIKYILSCDSANNKRTEPEKREAVSLLTQITAPWHGSEHKVSGIKDCVEGIVEGLTDIIEKTNCCQTLLLCAASLNNLSRLEVTSIYSIMSNESVVKLKESIEKRGPGVSIFLCEQIVGMLHNMSANKKCHSHLANINIINFITYIFQSQFYAEFNSRAENDAHRRTIKAILHIFRRLIHDSVVGQEILEHNFIPIFSKIERNLNAENEYTKDISVLTRQINECLSHKSFNRSLEGGSSNSSTSGTRFNLSRQESYV